VLGIDNIIFISILSSKLPKTEQAKARQFGLMGAFVSRVLLLLGIAWIVRLTEPLFTVVGVGISGRSLILIIGGLFLIGKATYEIHDKLEGEHESESTKRVGQSLFAVVLQIMVIDIVFSLDSVITAVGMVEHVSIMIVANVFALGVMLMAATPIATFVDRHPTIKILALAFLVLIGTNLVAEGIGQHIPKGYTYFAMAFSFLVEMLNLKLRARSAAKH
jgi:predicted tellurium resistance membrane protein TerC